MPSIAFCVFCLEEGQVSTEFFKKHSKQAILIATEPLHPQRKSLQAHCHGNMQSLPPPKSLTLLQKI